MKIVALEAENFKRLRAVHIRPDGSTVVIRGNNGAGKSSALDAIAAALGGQKLAPEVPVRRGQDQATVVVDLGDLIVERRWTAAGNSTLLVKSPEGARYPSPQAVLDKLVGKLSFDPLAFLREKPAVQAEILAKVLGLDFRAKDEERKRLYDERTVVNRDVQILRGAIARMPEVDAPDELVSVADLLAEQDRALAAQRAKEDAERAALSATTKRQNAETEVGRAVAYVAELEEKLRKARDLVKQWEGTVAKYKAAETELLAAAKAVEVPDPEGFRTDLRDAELVNERVRQKKARAAEVAKLEKKENESASLSDRIARLDGERAKAISDVQFPVPGLSFTDAGVLLDELPFEQASQAQQLRVSLAVGLALNPKLRVVLIRDGSLLDAESMRLVAKMAEEADAQVWLEVVGKGGTGVVIEDGTVESELPLRAEAAS